MIKARYYGKRIGKWVNKTYKSLSKFKKARIALRKKKGIFLKQTKTPYFKRRRY